MGLPYGSLTRSYACCCMPIFVFHPPCEVWLDGGQGAMIPPTPGFWSTGSPFYSGHFFSSWSLPRRSGPPGVSFGYFQRTIVRYTRFDHLTDRGLYPVLRTRPDLTSPQIGLSSTLGTGHTCTSTHAFASSFLQPLHCCNRPCLQLPFASVIGQSHEIFKNQAPLKGIHYPNPHLIVCY